MIHLKIPVLTVLALLLFSCTSTEKYKRDLQSGNINEILSMYRDDIIYYSDNLSKLLVNEIFSGNIYNVSDFESPPQSQPEIKFWLD